jgi:hypothetical protein
LIVLSWLGNHDKKGLSCFAIHFWCLGKSSAFSDTCVDNQRMTPPTQQPSGDRDPKLLVWRVTISCLFFALPACKQRPAGGTRAQLSGCMSRLMPIMDRHPAGEVIIPAFLVEFSRGLDFMPYVVLKERGNDCEGINFQSGMDLAGPFLSRMTRALSVNQLSWLRKLILEGVNC